MVNINENLIMSSVPEVLCVVKVVNIVGSRFTDAGAFMALDLSKLQSQRKTRLRSTASELQIY